MSKNIAIITAGGSGDRMDSQVPKQFLDLNGIPVIIHTLSKFEKCDDIDEIIVVCLHGWEDSLRKLASEYNITKLVTIVTGGNNSQESVSRGVDFMVENNYSDDDVVIVHESVRPFISDRIIRDNIKTCSRYGNSVTAIRGNESFLYSEDGVSSEKHYMREAMYMVQTPQTFKLGVLVGALNEAKKRDVVFQSLYLMMSELKYVPLYIVDGDRFNIKLTYPEDLRLFETLVSLTECDID